MTDALHQRHLAALAAESAALDQTITQATGQTTAQRRQALDVMLDAWRQRHGWGPSKVAWAADGPQASAQSA
jgi:hypothetical protein